MSNPEVQSNPEIKKVGNAVDSVAKRKLYIPIWVVAAVALVANLLGVVFRV